MVGLPDATVRESRDRVRTAIRNSGFPVPAGPGHGEPRAGGRAQGRRGVRSADRARHSRRVGRAAPPRGPPLHDRRRPVARRRRSRRCRVCCRSPSPRADRSAGADVSRRPISPKPASSTGCGSFRSRSLLRRGAGARCAEPGAGSRAAGAARRAESRPADDLADVRGQLRRRGARSRSPRPAAITCSSAARRARARRCWRGGCRGCCRRLTLRRGADGHDDSLGRRAPAARRRPDATRRRFARRITRARTSRSSAAAACRGPASSAWRTAACCSSTSCRSSAGACSRRCVSRSSRASCTSRARARSVDVSRARHARRRDEPVPVRISRRRRARRAAARPAIVERYQQRLSGPLRDRFDLGVEVPRRAVGGPARPAPARVVSASCGPRVEAARAASDRPAGRAQRAPRGPAPCARTAQLADDRAERVLGAGRRAARAERPGRDARPPGRPDHRRPRGRGPASSRGTWQRPCTSGCRIAVSSGR